MAVSDNELLLPAIQSDETETNTDSYPVIGNDSGTKMYIVNFLKGFANCIAYALIGSTLIVIFWFVFKDGQLNEFKQHILLCVLGYQLLMSQAILSMSSKNGWLSGLKLLHRRRLHWILQIAGSSLAIAGSSIMIRHKSVNFNSTHGKLALSALVFTSVSLVNGLTSLYSTQLRSYIPVNIFKISHVCFGTLAFIFSSVCLCFGYNKQTFKEWAGGYLPYFMMSITGTYALIVIASPCFNFWKKITFILRRSS